MVVTVDTMTLIWGVKKRATKGQEHMIDRTARFLRALSDNGDVVHLTSQVVAEYLGGYSEADRPAQLLAIRKYFPVHPFDLRAAEIAAELLHDNARIKAIQKEFGVSRQVVKADVAIVASAVAAQIQVIYTNDVKIKKAALGKILVKDIPDLPPPMKPQSLPLE